MPWMADRNYYLTADRARLVAESDKAAALLLVAAGCLLADEDAARYGLGAPPAPVAVVAPEPEPEPPPPVAAEAEEPEPEPEPETKAVEAAPANKAVVFPPANKRGGRH